MPHAPPGVPVLRLRYRQVVIPPAMIIKIFLLLLLLSLLSKTSECFPPDGGEGLKVIAEVTRPAGNDQTFLWTSRQLLTVGDCQVDGEKDKGIRDSHHSDTAGDWELRLSTTLLSPQKLY